jgi:hypothetical protein
LTDAAAKARNARANPSTLPPVASAPGEGKLEGALA